MLSFAHPDYDGAMEKQDEPEELGRGPANLFKGPFLIGQAFQKAQRSINRQRVCMSLLCGNA